MKTVIQKTTNGDEQDGKYQKNLVRSTHNNCLTTKNFTPFYDQLKCTYP